MANATEISFPLAKILDQDPGLHGSSEQQWSEQHHLMQESTTTESLIVVSLTSIKMLPMKASPPLLR